MRFRTRTNVLLLVVLLAANVLYAEQESRTSCAPMSPQPGWSKSGTYEEVFRTEDGQWVGCLNVAGECLVVVRGTNETFVALQRELRACTDGPADAMREPSSEHLAAEPASLVGASQTYTNQYRNMPSLTRDDLERHIEDWREDRDRSRIEKTVAQAVVTEPPVDTVAPRPPQNLFFIKSGN